MGELFYSPKSKQRLGVSVSLTIISNKNKLSPVIHHKDSTMVLLVNYSALCHRPHYHNNNISSCSTLNLTSNRGKLTTMAAIKYVSRSKRNGRHGRNVPVEAFTSLYVHSLVLRVCPLGNNFLIMRIVSWYVGYVSVEEGKRNGSREVIRYRPFHNYTGFTCL